jgi:RHH-type proline utilization regulon transcriptional repressor/proline dehydrogenase/delta 1-pyrroline-5-carboxylate dehydrogenase
MPSSRRETLPGASASSDLAWRPRAQEIARLLAERRGSFLSFDIQRVFAWLPPDQPAGEALFRLVEAFPRTPDRAGRRALVMEYVAPMRGRWRAAIALPFVSLATALIGRQFVYEEDVARACRRGERALRGSARARYSFDMLGEGARTPADAEQGVRRYLSAIDAVGRAALAQGHGERLGVSIKLSSVHARFDAAGFRRARAEIMEPLVAMAQSAARANVGLTIDAEESERLPLQLELFAELARRPEWLAWGGLGLAVQAYRTGALETIGQVVDLANERIGRGGAPITVRLVKGAYWDAEVKRAQELALDGYPVYTDKRGTDLSYVRCASRLLESAAAVFPQFATHNPVSAGCVLALAEAKNIATDRFEMQRLHGMGAPLDQALGELFPALGMRVYAPVGSRRELLAYLVRRLLENSASTSYVRQAARAQDPAALIASGFDFLDVPASPKLPAPRELHMPERITARGYDLGEPAALAATATKVEASRRAWTAAPLSNGKALAGNPSRAFSPARPDVSVGEVTQASAGQARAAIDSAYAARKRWAATDVEARAQMLERLADLLEADTHQLMALCVWEAGKTLPDALADVREAVDFCRYYAQQARKVFEPKKLASPAGESNVLCLHGRGVFACISPWNFPVAIFTGQVAAALVAGNAVVAKPAEQSPLTAYRVAELILEAGVPADAFHLLPGRGETVGKAIVEDPRIAGVVFTGSFETARAIQRSLAEREGPIVPFIAETGGLNAMIADSTALPEQVVDAVVASAFRSAGQRCSSLRMLYLQDEIAPAVIEMLRGAMAALQVGDPADPATDIGPLIDAEARTALGAYVEKLKNERPLIAEAKVSPGSGSFLAPVAFEVDSIRDLPGERFGPILHVARFAIDRLEAVVGDINAMGYGLTMGVHTRMDSRAEMVRRLAAVGNLYVNRNMIGAIVGVQPFGGEGLSGSGPKAGGPHYLPRFATERVYTVNTAAAGGDLGLLTTTL